MKTLVLTRLTRLSSLAQYQAKRHPAERAMASPASCAPLQARSQLTTSGGMQLPWKAHQVCN